MASVSVSALTEGARLYADERPGGSSAFISDSSAESMARRSVAKLRSLLTLERGHELYTSTSTYSTSAGTSSYSLPLLHESTLRVTLTESGSTYDLHPHELGEATDRQQAYFSAALTPTYRIRGSNIEINPTPTTAGTVVHLYTTASDTSATSYDLLVESWEEWVMLDVAVRMLQIQGLPHTWLREERDQLLETLKRQAQDRTVEEAIRIRDARPDVRVMRW